MTIPGGFNSPPMANSHAAAAIVRSHASSLTSLAPAGWGQTRTARTTRPWALGSTLKEIRDARGDIVQSPWALDGTGTKKPNPTDAPAVLGPFVLYEEVDFAIFNFT